MVRHVERQKPSNWRVMREADEVVAIEPGGRKEHVFPASLTPFWDAVEFAAARLREADALP